MLVYSTLLHYRMVLIVSGIWSQRATLTGDCTQRRLSPEHIHPFGWTHQGRRFPCIAIPAPRRASLKKPKRNFIPAGDSVFSTRDVEIWISGSCALRRQSRLLVAWSNDLHLDHWKGQHLSVPICLQKLTFCLEQSLFGDPGIQSDYEIVQRICDHSAYKWNMITGSDHLRDFVAGVRPIILQLF